jgi:hypothetical protein
LTFKENTPTPSVIHYLKENNSEGDYHHCTALPDTGTSRTIILKSLLDKAKIEYDTGVRRILLQQIHPP